MCLAIPGQILEFVDVERFLARVDVSGVRRVVNVALVSGGEDGAKEGDWVLIHVGFAISIVDEAEALATRRLLEQVGSEYEAELEGVRAKPDHMNPGIDPKHCTTCSDAAGPMCVESLLGDSGLAVCDGVTIDVRLVLPVEPADLVLSTQPRHSLAAAESRRGEAEPRSFRFPVHHLLRRVSAARKIARMSR